MTVIEYSLERSIRKLMPGQTPDEALAHLLLTLAKRKLVKYEAEQHRFERKYRIPFDQFREALLKGKPLEGEEQDYFDWELAVTGIAEMTDEIRYLESLA